ncbi:hypothetical protein V1517DRAFT_310115 [Lipomyces orientalis]|uniref:Uncharacterized protein n=1 Tax=Lipomyces orientalis TaxID=1233043 RepID=A0ACC3TG89_9ASCO
MPNDAEQVTAASANAARPRGTSSSIVANVRKSGKPVANALAIKLSYPCHDAISTAIKNSRIRRATIKDVPYILGFIKELAEYKHEPDKVFSKSIFGPFAYANVLSAQSKCSLRTPFRFCIKVCYCDRGYKSIMPEVPVTLPFEYIKTPEVPLAPPSGTSSGERTTTPLHCGDVTETESETRTKWKLNMGRDGTGSGSIFWRIRPSSLARVALAVSRLFSARI